MLSTRSITRLTARCAIGLSVLLCAGCLGPRMLSQYPARSASPYKLPWPADKTYWCTQSNNCFYSHTGSSEFSYDFYMPVGSEVSAARGGTVIKVIDRHDQRGSDKPNNKVVIDHGDKTFGFYLHLKKDGSLVSVGNHVKQGQVIALSGNTGISSNPHLHFHVAHNPQGRPSVPITFSDSRHRGIPRLLRRYKSANDRVGQRSSR